MAAEQEPHSLASTFPNPPPFWKDFTPDKVTRLETLRGEEAGKQDKDVAQLPARISGVPEELINLQPPAEPADGKWRVFGDQYTLDDRLPSLEDQGITDLVSSSGPTAKDAKHYDRALQLKRLAKSLLLNFLELAGTLAQTPDHAQAKIQDMHTLFINMHHVLNEYRPHQARESVIEMMQDHLDRTRTETMAIRTQVDKARRVLEGLGSISIPDAPAKDENKEEETKKREQMEYERDRELWATVDKLFA